MIAAIIAWFICAIALFTNHPTIAGIALVVGVVMVIVD
jgi:hypothetical protein